MHLFFSIVNMGRNPQITFPESRMYSLPGKVLENLLIPVPVSVGEKYQARSLASFPGTDKVILI